MSRLDLSVIAAKTGVVVDFPDTPGSDGSDRITKNVYDNASQLLQVRRAVGTNLEQAYATYSYTNNGKQQVVIDANGNRAKFEYDGYDRLTKWIFPSTTRPTAYNPSTPANALATAGSLNTNDYEQYGYDANGNRTSWRRRDASTLTFAYDALNRVIQKRVPDPVGGPSAGSSANCYSLASDGNDVCYRYDLRGRSTDTRFGSLSGQGIVNAYDGFDRLTSSTNSMGGNSRTLSYQYDAAGNRTRLTFPDVNIFTFTYDAMSRMTAIKLGSSTTITTLAYNNQGLRSGLAGVESRTSYGYDAIGRLTSLAHDLSGTAQDVSWSLGGYDAASEIKSQTLSNNSYAWTGFANANRAYTSNGLNQYSAVGTANLAYDANGNLTSDGSTTYAYDRENRLLRATGGSTATLVYDPMGRLFQTTSGSTVTQFLYDGDALVAEYNGSNVLQRRYVHGPKVDEPLIWYEGASLATRRLLRANPQGSIVSVADSGGTSLYINTYDPYGVPGSGNQGRFAYTGQIRIPEIGMYYYKARMYAPALGRFLQTDPVGYEDQINLYAYVANDPLNKTDPFGLRNCDPNDSNYIETPESAGNPGGPEPPTEEQTQLTEIVVTAHVEKKSKDGAIIPTESDKEKFYVVNIDGVVSRAMTTTNVACGGRVSVDVGRPGPLPNGSAGAHTHGPHHDSTPGPGDNIAAQASTTKAAFVMTSNNAFMVRSFGDGTYATNVISGPSLSDSQREALIRYMQGWERPVVNDTSLTDKQRFCPK